MKYGSFIPFTKFWPIDRLINGCSEISVCIIIDMYNAGRTLAGKRAAAWLASFEKFELHGGCGPPAGWLDALEWSVSCVVVVAVGVSFFHRRSYIVKPALLGTLHRRHTAIQER